MPIQAATIIPFPLRPRPPQQERRRTREYLTEPEMARLLNAAQDGPNGARNYAAVLLAYGHGLRCSELCRLRWSDVDLGDRAIQIRRAKGSQSGAHPLRQCEVDALVAIAAAPSDWTERRGYVFISNRGRRLSERMLAVVVREAGERAGLGDLRVHPHMLRHSCGYAMVNRGIDIRKVQAWLGHVNIRHTTHYAQLAPNALMGLWPD